MKRNMLKRMTVVVLAGFILSGCSGSDSEENVDLDLTEMSSTMVYAEVLNMMLDPESYEGMSICMDGTFSSWEDPDTGHVYYSCIIADATACCQQGVEFVLTDDYKYPEDYPKEGDPIEVTGVYELYEDGELENYHVAEGKLEKLLF